MRSSASSTLAISEPKPEEPVLEQPADPQLYRKLQEEKSNIKEEIAQLEWDQEQTLARWIVTAQEMERKIGTSCMTSQTARMEAYLAEWLCS